MKKILLTSVAYKILDKFIELLDTPPSNLTVAFIPTAADLHTDKRFVEKDKNKFIELGFHIVNIDIKNETYSDILKKLEKSDIIFVAGGNVFYLLQEMKRNGIDNVIKKHIENGKIYIGSSAGSIVIGPDIGIVKDLDSKKDAPELNSYNGLNVINYSIIPHCDDEGFKNKINKILEANKEYKHPIIKLNDNQAIFIEGNQLRFIENNE